jgi:hypothetical protein
MVVPAARVASPALRPRSVVSVPALQPIAADGALLHLGVHRPSDGGAPSRNVRPGVLGRFPRSVQKALIVGDAAAFLLFAGLGRDQHHESAGLFSVVVTATPFLVAWFAVAWPTGALDRAWSHLGIRSLRKVCLVWLAAWPIALMLRAVLQGRGIPLSFDLVALIVNALFLLGWRGVYLVLAGKRS